VSTTDGRYTVTAVTCGDGTSIAHMSGADLVVDSSPTQGDEHPGPADLLTAAFAACMLKNVARFGEILHFAWEHASVEVQSRRQDAPPKMTAITYRLTVVTDEPPRRVELLHRNLIKYGTIYNTLAAVCEVTGEVVTTPVP
jgi:uncharacterized OsmC-like protein